MLSDPWIQSRSESHGWTRSVCTARRSARHRDPLTPDLLVCPVHPNDVTRPSGHEDQGKVTEYPDPRGWGPQLKLPSWECSLLGTSAGRGVPGAQDSGGERWSFRGRKSETQALGCLFSTFHTNSQPRTLTFPKALVPGGSRDGYEEVPPPCGHYL